MFTIETVHNVMRPLLILNAILGMGVIQYPHGHPRTKLSFIYSLTCLLIYGVLFYISLEGFVYLELQTDVRLFMCKCLLITNCALTVCTIMMSWFRMRALTLISEDIEVVEELTLKLGIQQNYCQRYKIILVGITGVFVAILTVTIINALVSFVDGTPIMMKVTLTITLHYPMLLTHITDFTFLSIVRYTGVKFKELNDRLLGISHQYNNLFPEGSKGSVKHDKRLFQKTSFHSNYSDTINILRQAHFKLVKICHKANKIYGLSILISITLSFVMITGLFYNLYIAFFLSQDSLKMLHRELLSSCCWILFYVSKIIFLSYTCTNTSSEAMKISEIFPELLSCEDIRREVVNFKLQMMQNPLCFTAHGFCNIDYTLIRDMSSSITTYLVILVQFSDSSILTIQSKNETQVT